MTINSNIIQQYKKIPLHSLVCVFSDSVEKSIEISKKYFQEYEIISKIQIMIDYFNRVPDDDFRKDIFYEIKHRIRLKLFLGERVVFCSELLNHNLRNDIINEIKTLSVPIYYIVDSNIDLDFELIRGDHTAYLIKENIDNFNVVDKLPVNGDLLYEKIKNQFNGLTVIPDIHSSYDNFLSAYTWAMQMNHFIIMLGDIIDYGDDPVKCIELAYSICIKGQGMLSIGNHENKILKWLYNKNNNSIKLSVGNKVTVDAFQNLSKISKQKVENKFKTLMNLGRHHIRVKNVMFAHAAIDQSFWSLDSEKLYDQELKNLALYGQIDKEKPKLENGMPNRSYAWINNIGENQLVVVGHDIRSIVKPLEIKNEQNGSAVFLDLGSGKGGRLCTADIKLNNDSDFLRISNYNLY
jgi:protein phosphatase